MKEEMTGIWKKIYEQNYPRSLDHRRSVAELTFIMLDACSLLCQAAITTGTCTSIQHIAHSRSKS